MKLQSIIPFILCATALSTAGNNYIIKQINTPTLCVDGQELHVDDSFSDKAVITWSSDRQAVKVLTDDNRLIVLSAKTFRESGAGTFGDYVATYKGMSTRGEGSLVSEDDHRKSMTGTFVLMDTITFPTSWICDDNSYFGISGETMNIHRLQARDGQVLLTRNDIGIEYGDTIVNMLYIEHTYADTTVVTNKLRLIIVPAGL